MADCECLPKCPFFNDKMKNMPSLSSMLKKKYCQGDSAGCARYRVFKALGRDAVPGDLYPNNQDKADELLGIA